MSSKNKIKISSYKNKRGESVSVARVYSDRGELLSEHESTGRNTAASSQGALSKLQSDYQSNNLEGTDYDISNASIEHVPSKRPIVPKTSGTKSKSYEMGPMNITAKNPTQQGTSPSLSDSSANRRPVIAFDVEGNPIDSGGTIPEEYGPPISDDERKLLEEIESITVSDFVKITHGPKHIDWPPFDAGENGIGHKALSEPVPSYFARPGDAVLTAEGLSNEGGVNNNAFIVLGRDRNSIGEYNSSDLKRSQSGHSNKMGAGAIDIVVGRMAPFPMPGFQVSPLFNTKEIPQLKAEKLFSSNPDLKPHHPGVIMDAARIYISQMTDLDHNFGISRRMSPLSDVNTKVASSGIMLKADRVRMHARNDIKIVTGGQEELHTSMGVANDSFGGIHLIAGNGALGDQHPIPRGRNLQKAFDELLVHHNEFVDLVFAFIKLQMSYNKVTATHFHQSPAMGASTTPSITAWAMGVETSVSQFVNFMMEIPKHKSNADSYRKKFLTSSEDDYINSVYNTTN